jgi:hypothetical protein
MLPILTVFTHFGLFLAIFGAFEPVFGNIRVHSRFKNPKHTSVERRVSSVENDVPLLAAKPHRVHAMPRHTFYLS